MIAQLPVASFTTDAGDGCLGSELILTNTSTDALTYEWDFCLGDFEINQPLESSRTITGLSNGFGYVVREDGGIWYSFLVSAATNSIIRLTHGDSPLNAPTDVDDLGGFGLLVAPESIDIIQFGGTWYGVIGGFNNGTNLTRLDFPSGLGGTVMGTNLGDFGFNSDRKRKVQFINESNNLILMFSAYNTNRLVRVNYGNSFDNVIDINTDIYTSTVANLSFITGFDVKKIDGNYVVHALSILSPNIVRLNFGNSLLNTPSSEGLYSANGLSNGYRIEFLEESGTYYGTVGSTTQGLRIFDFGDLTSSQNPLEVTFNSNLQSIVGFRVFHHNGNSYIQGIASNSLHTLSFIASCSSLFGYSEIAEPEGLIYNDSGTKEILLRAFDADENVSISIQSVEISNNVKPSISYTSENVCLSNINTFTPSNSGLTSYSWDFNGDGIEDSNLENPTFDFSSLGAGTYTVRVDVSDGTCNNFFEQDITIYDPPPAPSYNYNAPRLCVNADIDFTNATNDATYAGPLVYTWEFIDDVTGTAEGTSNVKNPTFAFPSAGNKTVRLTSSIPGCEEITEQTIVIDAGPTANFNAPVVCLGENMTFTNTSVNGTTYEWDFGDGFTATNENPSHLFTAPGNYSVTLRAIDAQGCDDTEVIEVAVSDIPQVSFDFDVPCTSSSGISFLDLSSIENADLIGWSWRVDGVEVSTEQNPTLSFTEGGVKNIALVAYSSNGCEATYNEDVDILTSPTPDFNAIIACQGEVSTFEDITFAEGNTIVSWLWEMDGRVYTSQNVNHVFNAPGFYNITLEVTGQNLCSEIITRAIEVLTLPTVDFSVQGDCDNVLLTIEDQSTDSNDPILSRNWMLDGANVGNGSQLFLENLNEGTYDLSLEVTTTAGCIVSSTQSLVINPSPTSVFTFNRAYGLPGDQLTFTNNSQGASAYQWLVDGAVISTSSTTQNIIFDEPGTYQVSLVSENTLGCSDTLSQEVIIAIPEVDLRIGDFDFVQEDAVGRIFLEIENNSNLPVEVTEAQVELENQFSVTETIAQYIGIGETQLVGLKVGIPLALAQPTYFCVTLASQYAGYPDINPIDNEKCITLQPKVAVEDPFPNPVQDQFRMKVIVPEVTTATITLLNAAGKSQSRSSFTTIEGLNSFFVDMSTKDPGIYFIILEVMDQTFERKIIKI